MSQHRRPLVLVEQNTLEGRREADLIGIEEARKNGDLTDRGASLYRDVINAKYNSERALKNGQLLSHLALGSDLFHKAMLIGAYSRLQSELAKAKNASVPLNGLNIGVAPAGPLAAESNTVIFNNGWRTLDGKFASPLSSVRPGGSAEVGVWDAIAAKPGWSVRTGNIAVRDASGQLRYYDGIAISPSGRIIGLEVKSGDASRTVAQRLFDTILNSSPSNVAKGVGQSVGTTVQRSILIRSAR